VVDCGQLPVVDHMVIDNNATTVWSQVTVSAEPFYSFTVNMNSSYELSDNFTIRNITCLPDGTWSVQLTDINTQGI
jgi:hypothetical protein